MATKGWASPLSMSYLEPWSTFLKVNLSLQHSCAKHKAIRFCLFIPRPKWTSEIPWILRLVGRLPWYVSTPGVCRWSDWGWTPQCASYRSAAHGRRKQNWFPPLEYSCAAKLLWNSLPVHTLWPTTGGPHDVKWELTNRILPAPHVESSVEISSAERCLPNHFLFPSWTCASFLYEQPLGRGAPVKNTNSCKSQQQIHSPLSTNPDLQIYSDKQHKSRCAKH